MAITVDVKPDLSRFREASLDEIIAVLRDLVLMDDIETPVISEANARAAAKLLLKHFVILPR